MHGFCGQGVGEEGYGQPRICTACSGRDSSFNDEADPELEGSAPRGDGEETPSNSGLGSEGVGVIGKAELDESETTGEATTVVHEVEKSSPAKAEQKSIFHLDMSTVEFQDVLREKYGATSPDGADLHSLLAAAKSDDAHWGAVMSEMEI